jgi:23S rRNA (adenine1618-N6)-methyltransferase
VSDVSLMKYLIGLQDVARGQVPQKEILPFPTEMAVSNYGRGKEATAATIDSIMTELDLAWMWKPERSAGMALAKSNVWSRSGRRKKLRDQEAGVMDVDSDSDGDSEVALCVKITVRPKDVSIRWLRGQDHVTFESFCTMIKRKLFSASGSAAVAAQMEVS